MNNFQKVTKASVTNFIHCKDDYLFITRKRSSKVMSGQTNAIGGKLELGEDYISAAVRETKEETGYDVDKNDIKFCGIIKFENSGGDDWYTCFFKISVRSQKLPPGNKNLEGKLIWLNSKEVLKKDLKWADDMNYIWDDIEKEDKLFFLTAKVSNDNFIIRKVEGDRINR